jgi:hypothetical protein
MQVGRMLSDQLEIEKDTVAQLEIFQISHQSLRLIPVIIIINVLNMYTSIACLIKHTTQLGGRSYIIFSLSLVSPGNW